MLEIVINYYFYHEIVNKIKHIPIPTNTNIDEFIYMGPTSNGKFFYQIRLLDSKL